MDEDVRAIAPVANTLPNRQTFKTKFYNGIYNAEKFGTMREYPAVAISWEMLWESEFGRNYSE